jgi:N-acyl-D-aspartate/D-glutamate deacylase
MFDLVIHNAKIYDGLGGAPRMGSLAVNGERIAAMGEDVGPARTTINADGLALMPGIIDSHTHYDAQITWDALASPSPQLGVTTAVMGNCGFTIAPCRPADRDLNLRNLTHVEGMSLESLRAGVNWQFETFPQYLDYLQRAGVGPNIAAYIGHSSVRTYVMGEDASKRVATLDEIEQMRRIVKEGLQAGAVGLSSTTSYQHNGDGGVPMPSRLASDEEFHALVSALGETGRGTFMMTKSADTKPAWLQALAASAKRPFLAAAILHNPGVPEAAWNDMLGVAEGCARGLSMYGAVSCCQLKFEFNMREPYIFEGLRSWRPVLEARAEGAAALYANSQFRQSVKDELAVPMRRIFAGDWDKVEVILPKLPQHKAYEGKSVAKLAAAAGKHPFDWLLDLSLAEDLDTLFTAVLLNSDEEQVARLLTHPNSIVSLSDAGAHMTFFCDAGFGLHLLGYWVREKGLMSFERAVQKLTSDQARLFGMQDRGVLRAGAYADLLLFDPTSVGRADAQRHFDLPGGGSRLLTAAQGVHGVWVNGTLLADEEGLRADAGRPGKVLREFAA